MNAVITKEDVLNARNALLAKNKRPGPRTIYTHLGRGSLTTITKLLREIEAQSPKPTNEPEVQEAFQKFWSIAAKAGKDEAEAQIKELNETQLGLMEENDRLQAELQASEERAAMLEKSHAGLTEDLRNALEAAEKARVAGESYTTKFAEALERIEKIQAEHAATLKSEREESEKHIQNLRAELASEHAGHTAAQSRIHELELALARAEAKLESAGLFPKKDVGDTEKSQNTVQSNKHSKKT